MGWFTPAPDTYSILPSPDAAYNHPATKPSNQPPMKERTILMVMANWRSNLHHLPLRYGETPVPRGGLLSGGEVNASYTSLLDNSTGPQQRRALLLRQ
ncbi:MAG: hypothetical protein KatS3mg022_3044 [Armatimonadota bacterium]|nr:MAG: hypothetical protein KatS3mg022_3044 [Armatimonadota bacterium]GIV18257.1 MAG: hypothetical protein KatS3mg023_0008 [Armatimonadota bacterium]GIV22202.1 MAG: hypothetical protein KatS3mg023_3953 [Armatimonadota bacterium]